LTTSFSSTYFADNIYNTDNNDDENTYGYRCIAFIGGVIHILSLCISNDGICAPVYPCKIISASESWRDLVFNNPLSNGIWQSPFHTIARLDRYFAVAYSY